MLANGLGLAADKGVYVTDALPADLDQYNVYDMYDKEISFSVSPGVKSVLERSASRRRVADVGSVGEGGGRGGSGDNANSSKIRPHLPPQQFAATRPLFGRGFASQQQIEEKTMDVLSSSSSIASHLLPVASADNNNDPHDREDAVERGTKAGLYGGYAPLSNADGLDASSSARYGFVDSDNDYNYGVAISSRRRDDEEREKREEEVFP